MARTTPAGRDSLYRKTVLKNGLRVISERVPSVRSISLGVWIDVGSRHEQPKESGLSHYIEHMLFKGTRRRSAKQIAASLESIGGSLNGFTSREQTCYTARILDEHLVDAVDVLADMTCHATMTPANMNKERLVICEEIKDSLDTPSDHIHDLFASTFWGEHPLGRPIMGSQEIIMNMTRARMMSYRNRNYCAGSVVIAASGAISHNKLVRLAREKFSFPDGEAGPAENPLRTSDKSVSVIDNDTAQTHFCLGFPGVSFSSIDRLPVLALSTYLGGGMSSTLFQKIREQRGLAYQVYTYHDIYRDSGIFGAYLGTDRTHLKEAFNVIMKEFRTSRKKKLTSTVLNKVKAQLKGHLTIGLESTSARMSRLARQELLTGTYQPIKQTLREIDQISPSSVLDVANRIFDESRMAIAVLGPADKHIFDGVT